MDSTTTAPIGSATARGAERAVLPTGMVHRTSRLLALPARHAVRTVAAVTRLSSATTEQIAARSAEQVFATSVNSKAAQRNWPRPYQYSKPRCPTTSPPRIGRP
jgi:hypothetical protein